MRSILRSLPAAFRRRGLRIAATLVLRAVLNLAGLAALLPVLTLALPHQAASRHDAPNGLQ